MLSALSHRHCLIAPFVQTRRSVDAIDLDWVTGTERFPQKSNIMWQCLLYSTFDNLGRTIPSQLRILKLRVVLVPLVPARCRQAGSFSPFGRHFPELFESHLAIQLLVPVKHCQCRTAAQTRWSPLHHERMIITRFRAVTGKCCFRDASLRSFSLSSTVSLLPAPFVDVISEPVDDARGMRLFACFPSFIAS